MASAKALGYRFVYIQGQVRQWVSTEHTERWENSKEEGQRVSWALWAKLRTLDFILNEMGSYWWV